MRPVIICGGIGTKIWPLSRPSSPKHFLPLVKGKSLFQCNYKALLPMFSPSQIYIQTTPEQAKIAHRQAPQIPAKNYFIEPEFRHQGPATAFMAARLFHLAPDEPFMLIQADNLRLPNRAFLRTVKEVEKLIIQEKKLITGGFVPEFSLMGVDYLLPGKQVPNTGKVKIYKMKKWLGRDSKEEVEMWLKKNTRLFLHTNHYAWTPRLMLQAIQHHKPDWHRPLLNIIADLGTKKADQTIKKEYRQMEPGPIELVTSQELNNGFVFETPFKWIDIGTWESMDKYYRKAGLYQDPPLLVSINSQNNFVYQTNKKKIIGLVGVENLAIVDTPDGLLVCRLDQSGRVGEIVAKLPLDTPKKA